MHGKVLTKKSNHVLAWSIFIIYEIVVIRLIFNSYEHPLTYFLHYTFIIVLFYAYSGYFLPWALNKKESKLRRIYLSIFFYLTTYVLVQYLTGLTLISLNVIIVDGKHPLNYQFISKNLNRGVYFLGLSSGYFLIKERLTNQKKHEILRQKYLNSIIQQQKIKQQLCEKHNAYLKAQINPHFLFNTLDFIYHNINHNPNIASDAIIYLSRLMRYSIDSDKQGDFTPIIEEIKYVETLIQLYTMKTEKQVDFKIKYENEVINLHFIPFILLTIAENIFKHGDVSGKKGGATIKLYVNNNIFFIESRNAMSNNTLVTTTGKGLKNINQRLIYTYGEKTSFRYETDVKGMFIIKISIPFDKMEKEIN